MAHSKARIEDHGDWLLVAVPFNYEVKEGLKSFPGSLWRPERKAWRVPARYRADVRRLLVEHGLLSDFG